MTYRSSRYWEQQAFIRLALREQRLRELDLRLLAVLTDRRAA